MIHECHFHLRKKDQLEACSHQNESKQVLSRNMTAWDQSCYWGRCASHPL